MTLSFFIPVFNESLTIEGRDRPAWDIEVDWEHDSAA